MEIERLERLRRLLDKLARGRPGPNKTERAYLSTLFKEEAFVTLSWVWGPEVEFAEVGSNACWEHGVVTEAGWYVHPFCLAGCCRPAGPFGSRDEALLTHRRELLPDAFRSDIKLDIERLIHPIDADNTTGDAVTTSC